MSKHYIADLHLHSPFSRATSKEMTLDNLSLWARRKGISLLAACDWTHPDWFGYLKQNLKKTSRIGIWSYDGVDYVLGTEVSNIFSRNKRVYRVHTLIYSPSFDDVFRINEYLSDYGRLSSDGRPMLKLDIEKMCLDLLNISPDSFVVFAHVWTPWYAIFGASSGFDSVGSAFPSGVPDNVVGFETGLSSDPPMNWRVGFLDDFCLVSSSDAHSPVNLGREATVFSSAMDFFEMREALKNKDNSRLLYTIEFFPQEGKYHYDGHRRCAICLHPEETIKHNGICPVCGRPVTVGVLNRIYSLSRGRAEKDIHRIGYKYQVPLLDILSYIYKKGKQTKTVMRAYLKALEGTTEFDILFDELALESSGLSGEVKDLVRAINNGKASFSPGYDGEYGKLIIAS